MSHGYDFMSVAQIRMWQLCHRCNKERTYTVHTYKDNMCCGGMGGETDTQLQNNYSITI